MPKQIIRYYWITILMSCIIFLLSTLQFSTVPKVASFSGSDKLAHLFLYTVLGFFAYFNYKRDKYVKHSYPNMIYSLFAILILFGGVIEIVQELFFKPRSAELLDWIADIIGLIIGGFLGRFLFK